MSLVSVVSVVSLVRLMSVVNVVSLVTPPALGCPVAPQQQLHGVIGFIRVTRV
jgi:hypothetical protein